MPNLLLAYLEAVAQLFQRGHAREESYYSALEDLLKAPAQDLGRTVQITVLPKPKYWSFEVTSAIQA